MKKALQVSSYLVIALVCLAPVLFVVALHIEGSWPLAENHFRRGKDTAAFWKDGRYEIGRYPGIREEQGADSTASYYVLESGDPSEGVLLEDVSAYRIMGETAYLIAGDGRYGILDLAAEAFTAVDTHSQLSAAEQAIFDHTESFTMLHDAD